MRNISRIAKAVLLLIIGSLSHAAVVRADTLNLNYERTSLGTTTVSTAATQVPVPGTYTYANSVPHTAGTVSGTSDGFYNDYIFAVGAGQIDSVTSTIDIGGLLGITNFQVRLFSVADAASPGTTGPAGASLIQAWSTAVSCGSGCTGSIEVINPHQLAAGIYDLQIIGTADTLGGSYSGVLNTAPVPLPAAFPLLLSGIGLLSGALRRRSRLTNRDVGAMTSGLCA